MPDSLDLKTLEEKLKAQREGLSSDVKTLLEEQSTAGDEKIKDINTALETLDEQIKAVQENQKKQAAAVMPGLEDEKKEFDFSRFVKAASLEKGGYGPKAWEDVDAGYEREVVEQYAKKRDMRAGDGTEGGYLIPDEISSELVDLTIANMAVMKMGVTQLTGLVGDLPIPRQTARNTAYWVGETEAPTESSVTFDQFTLRPKKLGALTRFSGRLLYQTRGLINQIVKNSLSEAMALKLDEDLLSGTGADSEPKGLLNQTGLTTYDNQATSAVRFRLDKAAGMIQAIDVANELKDGGNFGFIMRPEVQGGMRRERIPQFTGQPIGQGQPLAGPSDILMSNEQLSQRIGYQIQTTTQLPNTNTRGTSTSASQVIFGNWKQMYVGFWRGMEIKVSGVASVGGIDAFSRDFVWVVAFQEADCNFGRLTAFTTVSDAETDESLWTNG